MTGRLPIVRVGLITLGTLFVAGSLAWGTNTWASDKAAKANVKWDEQASKDLAAALHHMHEVANAGDMDALKKLIAGDDVLVTFELDSDNHTPVPLRSKQDLFKFFDRVASDAGSQNATFILDMPKMKCRATADFGVCTEECTVRLKLAGGTERVDKLFGTAVAVRYEDGWRWIQWHMSVGPQSKENQDKAKTNAHKGHTGQ